MTLTAFLDRLKRGEAVAVDAWPEVSFSPEDVGLEVQAGVVQPMAQDRWLDVEGIGRGLGDGWRVEVVNVIESTNSTLMERARSRSVHHEVLTAEFQSAGRGRRGRQWFSPVARNLAVSFGFASTRPAFKLGGASLVVGLGVRRALSAAGATGIQLKWPNDVLVDGRKLCGILVEISAVDRTELVIGIGVNVSFRPVDIERIDQPVVDLRQLGVTANRSDLVVAIVSAVGEALDQFEKAGFEPFLQEYDEAHALHDQPCRLQLGDSWIDGHVLGVGGDGQLRLRTDEGETSYSAGEVSLRPAG